MDLKKYFEDSRKYDVEIQSPANLMKIYKLAVDGYGPAQEAICNRLLFIGRGFYNKLISGHEDSGSVKTYEDDVIQIIKIISLLLPVDKEYAKITNNQIKSNEEFDFDSAISNIKFDLSNDFCNFIFKYMMAISNVDRNDILIKIENDIIKLADLGCPAACYFEGMDDLEVYDITDENCWNTAIDYLTVAADNGFLSAAFKIIHEYEDNDDLMKSNYYKEKYTAGTSLYDELTSIFHGTHAGAYAWKWMDYSHFFLSGMIAIDNMNIQSRNGSDNCLFGFQDVFRYINWLLVDRCPQWKNLYKSHVIKLGMGISSDSGIDIKKINCIKYFEVPLWLFQNKVVLLITNYAIYFSENTKMERIILKYIDEEKIGSLKELLFKDKKIYDISSEIVNCIYWIKNIYDKGSYKQYNNNANFNSEDVRYSCEIRKYLISTICHSVIDELVLKYDENYSADEKAVELRYKNYWTKIETIAATLPWFAQEDYNDSGTYRAPIFKPEIKKQLYHDYGIDEEEKIYIVTNCSSFVSLKTGILLSERGIYCKDKARKVFIDWNDFTSDDYSRGIFNISIKDVKISLSNIDMDVIMSILGCMIDDDFYERRYGGK